MESDRPVGASFFLLEIVLAQTPSTDDSLTLTPETAFSYEADCQPGDEERALTAFIGLWEC